MLFFVILYVFGKMMFDRWKNAKAVEHKIQVMILHKAGQPTISLMPIETIGGEACVKVKTKNDADPIIHMLGALGEFPWVYPLGKGAFVQAGVQGIIYSDSDSEPLSNTSDVSEISAQSFGSIAQAIGLATSSAMQKSSDDSPDSVNKKQKSGLKWVYVGMIVLGTIGIISIVMTSQGTNLSKTASTMATEAVNILKSVNGLK